MSVEFVKVATEQNQDEDFERACTSNDGWEGDSQGEGHLECSSGGVAEGFVEGAETFRNPDEESVTIILLGLWVSVDINIGGLDIGLGPEGINQEVVLVGECSDKERKPKSGPFESSHISHNSSDTNNGGDGNTNGGEVLLESVGGVDVVAGGSGVDCVHDAEKDLEDDPNYSENSIVSLVFCVRADNAGVTIVVVHSSLLSGVV